MSNWQRENRTAPSYGCAPVSSGPWWLGFNDALEGRDYSNDYILRVDASEYQHGFAAGAARRQNVN